jgi:NAD(P)H dehydrogenase (quinone)
MPDTLLVTGATGHLGQRVLHHVVDTLRVPGNRIIATTRKPESLSAWAVKGVVVRTADFENTASLPDAFRGAGRLLLISTPRSRWWDGRLLANARTAPTRHPYERAGRGLR